MPSLRIGCGVAYHRGVPPVSREQVSLRFDLRLARRRPLIEIARHTLRPTALPRLDALVATPPDPVGVLIYFPGFGTPVGPWESAKCQYLAAATSLQIVLTEIPGMSRHGYQIPHSVRADLLRGKSAPWAELNLAYIQAALSAGGSVNTEIMQALGYSTGCSLAAAALPALAEWGPVEALHLVEPVAISRRNLASLQAHNMVDFGLKPVALATNLGHDWVMRAYRRQRREPKVRYSAADLLAIATMLSGEELGRHLDEVELAWCSLARGSQSSLCRRSALEQVDTSLAVHGVPGPTITVEGLGHQLWHSFPTVTQLIDAMVPAESFVQVRS